MHLRKNAESTTSRAIDARRLAVLWWRRARRNARAAPVVRTRATPSAAPESETEMMFEVHGYGAIATIVLRDGAAWPSGLTMVALLAGTAFLLAAAGVGIVLSRVRALSVGLPGRPPRPVRVRRRPIVREPVAPLAAALLGSLALAPLAHAGGTPAATLLLPYFEVQLPAAPGAPVQGSTTWLTLTNAQRDATLTRVVVWSDLAVPVYGFNVHLERFATQRIDLQQVLIGNVPQTGGPDQPEKCEAYLPPPRPSAAEVAELQALLTGKPSPRDGKCAGFDHGERIARGYVTVDVVNRCDKVSNPSLTGYFAPGGTGIASNANVLIGGALMLDPTKKSAIAVPVAHLTVPAKEIPEGVQTFYGRYVGKTALDGRTALGSEFAAQYYAGTDDALAPRATALFVWRDTQSPAADRFACQARPTWYPLAVTAITAVDLAGTPSVLPLPSSPLPLAANRIRLGSSDLALPYDEGWLYLDLDLTEPKLEEPQSFVTVLYRSRGRVRTAAPAARFARE